MNEVLNKKLDEVTTLCKRAIELNSRDVSPEVFDLAMETMFLVGYVRGGQRAQRDITGPHDSPKSDQVAVIKSNNPTKGDTNGD